MDKTDYAIIGWVDEGKPANPAALTAMLGAPADEVAERIVTLRTGGILPHQWTVRYAQKRLTDNWHAPITQRRTT